jgi:hypothetical protein
MYKAEKGKCVCPTYGLGTLRYASARHARETYPTLPHFGRGGGEGAKICRFWFLGVGIGGWYFLYCAVGEFYWLVSWVFFCGEWEEPECRDGMICHLLVLR